jgi:hypothetical protein
MDALRASAEREVADLMPAPDPYLQHMHTTNVMRTMTEAMGA